MLEWQGGKFKRTWRNLGRRLRAWGYAAGFALSTVYYVCRLAFGSATVNTLFSTLAVPVVMVSLAAFATIVVGWLVAWRQTSSAESTLRFCEEEGWIELVSVKGVKRYRVDQVLHAHFIGDRQDESGTLEFGTKDGATARVWMDAAHAHEVLQRTKLGPRHRAHRIESQLVGKEGMGCFALLLTVPSMLATFFLLTGPAMGLEAMAGGDLDLALSWLHPIGSIFGILGFMVLSAVDITRVVSQAFLGQFIHLGTDGIRWGKRLWPKFVAYRDIASMELLRDVTHFGTGGMVRFETHDGQQYRISLHGLFTGAEESVLARLQGALDHTAQILMPQLSRQGRNEEEWRKTVRALIEQRDDYRRAPVSRGRVRELLRDPVTLPEQRLGAALALVEARDTPGMRILTEVSQATVEPDIRMQLAQLAKQAETLLAEEDALQLEETEEADRQRNR